MKSDDYYNIDFKGGSFYYGYEVAFCHVCESMQKNGQEYCEDEDHDDSSWCFKGVIGDFVRIYTSKGLGADNLDVDEGMEAGISKFMDEYLDFKSNS